MGNLILTNRRTDRPSTFEEIGEEMRRKWGDGCRLDVIQPAGAFARKMALLTVPSHENPITPNHLTGETAELEWWQTDNHLLGVGFAYEASEAGDRALAMADRGTLARYSLTVWFCRTWRKFRFFRRSRRDAGNYYKPIGRELTPPDILTLFT